MARLLWLLVVCLFAGMSVVSADDAVLPASAWVAVVWQASDDSLHWVNVAGEQASIVRPRLPDEAADGLIDLHVSPDQHGLVLVARLLNGNQGIGFYDLQRGQFLRTHEAQPGESIEPSSHQPLASTSDRFAAALYTLATGAWRIIDFDLQTGNALAQLTSADANAPAAPSASWWPQIVAYETGDASRIHVQFVTTPEQPAVAEYPSFVWNPAVPPGDASVTAGILPYNDVSGFDIEPASGQVVYTSYDPQFGEAPAQSAATTVNTRLLADSGATAVFVDAAANPHQPRWLNGGQWLGFRVGTGFEDALWSVMPAAGDGGTPETRRILLGSDITDVFGTPDGYLALDAAAGALFHQTALGSDSSGEPVFQAAPGAAFAVVHVTPPNLPVAQTTLANALAGQQLQPRATDAPDATPLPQPPQVDCPGAPAPRLAVGAQALVTQDLSQPLRVRVTPGGGIVTGLLGGARVNVIGGPTCLNRLLWWELQLPDGLTGWSAEASGGGVFLEPVGVAPAEAAGFPPPGDVSLVPIVTLAPVCSLAPAQIVGVGGQYRVTVSGMLGLRSQSTDEYPSRQLADGQLVTVTGGPLCYDGYRMWQVETLIGEDTITGWIFDGAYDRVYLVAP